MQIWLTIDYHGDRVLAFAPEKVLDKVKDFFPQAEFDKTDYGLREVDRMTGFANERVSEERRADMIEQIRGKYRRNGPTYKFSVALGGGAKIDGHARRYSVRFACEPDFDAATEKTVIELPRSIKYGEISSDRKTECFCVPDEFSETRWFLPR
ncbi:MAG TPA: hypothetical protein VIL74_01850 [Pyrinomonadaceae bacterium]|jgi:hypothetical protein